MYPLKLNEGQDLLLSENEKLFFFFLNLKAIHVSFDFQENSS